MLKSRTVLGKPGQLFTQPVTQKFHMGRNAACVKQNSQLDVEGIITLTRTLHFSRQLKLHCLPNANHIMPLPLTVQETSAAGVFPVVLHKSE